MNGIDPISFQILDTYMRLDLVNASMQSLKLGRNNP